MNRRPSELALVAVSLVCVLILAACHCAPTLRYITITPSGPTTVPGAQVAFTATGYYSNGAVTPNISVSWSSSSAATATINGTSDITHTLIDPYGRFLFVADQSTPAATGGIYVYSINQTSGALTMVTGSPFTANLNIPAGLAIDQSGTYLYASNFGFPPATPNTAGTTLAGFQFDPNAGTLTALSTPTFTNTLSGPYYMAWDPTGTYL